MEARDRDLLSIEDTLLDFIDEPNNDDAVYVWERLPDKLKMDVVYWGASDTVVREDIYQLIESDIKKFIRG